MDGRYIYTPDLLKLDSTVKARPKSIVDPRLTGVTTPLRLDAWKQCVRHHPDRDFTDYILRGIQHGFHIGINASVALTSAIKNMSTAHQHPEVIDEYLQKELDQSNILGLFPLSYAPMVHVNRFRVVPKTSTRKVAPDN